LVNSQRGRKPKEKDLRLKTPPGKKVKKKEWGIRPGPKRNKKSLASQQKKKKNRRGHHRPFCSRDDLKEIEGGGASDQFYRERLQRLLKPGDMKWGKKTWGQGEGDSKKGRGVNCGKENRIESRPEGGEESK